MSEEKDPTYSDYWSEIESCAAAIKADVRNGYDLSDAVHETVDGHEYIIYTAKAVQVLAHTRNEDALFAEMGAQTFDGYADAMTKMAFYAMRQDLYDELDGWSGVDDDPDEDDEDDEDEDEDSDAEQGFVPEPEPDDFELWVGYTHGRNEVDVEVINLLDARLSAIDREDLILWYHEARRRGSRELYSVRKVLNRAERESFASWASILDWSLTTPEHRVFDDRMDDLEFQHLTTRIVDEMRRE